MRKVMVDVQNSLYIQKTFLTAAIVMEERFQSGDEEMRTLKARNKKSIKYGVIRATTHVKHKYIFTLSKCKSGLL